MINSVSLQTGSLTNYYSRIDSTDKIEIPLPSSISVYAQFKYVRGVPASSSQQPVSLNKAQIIDNMVSFLNNKSNDVQLDKREEFNIQELEGEVHRVISEEPKSFNSLPGFTSDTGVIFSLTA